MCLSRIQSLRLAAVLEDCSDQLDILGHALTVQINRERSSAAPQVTLLYFSPVHVHSPEEHLSDSCCLLLSSDAKLIIYINSVKKNVLTKIL